MVIVVTIPDNLDCDSMDLSFWLSQSRYDEYNSVSVLLLIVEW